MSSLTEHFFLDRGFRDVGDLLTEKGFEVLMPAFLTSGQNQFTAQQCNENKIITKLRQIVECVHGDLKTVYTKFQGRVRNRALLSSLSDWKNMCAMYNVHHERRETDVGNENAVAQKLLENRDNPNLLKTVVLDNRLNSKHRMFTPTSFEDRTESPFPSMTEEEVYFCCAGNYSKENAMSYIRDHLKRKSVIGVQIARSLTDLDLSGFGDLPTPLRLLKCKVPSRFSRNKDHYCYILFNHLIPGPDGVFASYCTCKSGARTNATCGHLTSLIWYFGYARNQAVSPITPHMLESLYNTRFVDGQLVSDDEM